jgi:hypothetical protein
MRKLFTINSAMLRAGCLQQGTLARISGAD